MLLYKCTVAVAILALASASRCPATFEYNSEFKQCIRPTSEETCKSFKNYHYSGELCYVPPNQVYPFFVSYCKKPFQQCENDLGHCCAPINKTDCAYYSAYYKQDSKGKNACIIPVGDFVIRGKPNETCPQGFSWDADMGYCTRLFGITKYCSHYPNSKVISSKCCIPPTNFEPQPWNVPKKTCLKGFIINNGICEATCDNKACKGGVLVDGRCYMSPDPKTATLTTEKPSTTTTGGSTTTTEKIPDDLTTTSASTTTETPPENEALIISNQQCPVGFLRTNHGCVGPRTHNCAKYKGRNDGDLCIITFSICPKDFVHVNGECIGDFGRSQCKDVKGTYNRVHKLCVVLPKNHPECPPSFVWNGELCNACDLTIQQCKFQGGTVDGNNCYVIPHSESHECPAKSTLIHRRCATVQKTKCECNAVNGTFDRVTKMCLFDPAEIILHEAKCQYRFHFNFETKLCGKPSNYFECLKGDYIGGVCFVEPNQPSKLCHEDFFYDRTENVCKSEDASRVLCRHLRGKFKREICVSPVIISEHDHDNVLCAHNFEYDAQNDICKAVTTREVCLKLFGTFSQRLHYCYLPVRRPTPGPSDPETTITLPTVETLPTTPQAVERVYCEKGFTLNTKTRKCHRKLPPYYCKQYNGEFKNGMCIISPVKNNAEETVNPEDTVTQPTTDDLPPTDNTPTIDLLTTDNQHPTDFLPSTTQATEHIYCAKGFTLNTKTRKCYGSVSRVTCQKYNGEFKNGKCLIDPVRHDPTSIAPSTGPSYTELTSCPTLSAYDPISKKCKTGLISRKNCELMNGVYKGKTCFFIPPKDDDATTPATTQLINTSEKPDVDDIGKTATTTELINTPEKPKIKVGGLPEVQVHIYSCAEPFVYNPTRQVCMGIVPEEMCKLLLETGVKGMWSGGEVCYIAADPPLSVTLTPAFLCGGEGTPFEPCIDSPGHCCFIGPKHDCDGYSFTEYNATTQLCRARLGEVHPRTSRDVKCPHVTWFRYDVDKRVCKIKNKVIGNICDLIAGARIEDDICYVDAKQVTPGKRQCSKGFTEDLGVCSKRSKCNNGESIHEVCFPAPNRPPIPGVTTPNTVTKTTGTPESTVKPTGTYESTVKPTDVAEEVRTTLRPLEVFPTIIKVEFFTKEPKRILCPPGFLVNNYTNVCIKETTVAECIKLNGTYASTTKICMLEPLVKRVPICFKDLDYYPKINFCGLDYSEAECERRGYAYYNNRCIYAPTRKFTFCPDGSKLVKNNKGQELNTCLHNLTKKECKKRHLIYDSEKNQCSSYAEPCPTGYTYHNGYESCQRKKVNAKSCKSMRGFAHGGACFVEPNVA